MPRLRLYAIAANRKRVRLRLSPGSVPWLGNSVASAPQTHTPQCCGRLTTTGSAAFVGRPTAGCAWPCARYGCQCCVWPKAGRVRRWHRPGLHLLLGASQQFRQGMGVMLAILGVRPVLALARAASPGLDDRGIDDADLSRLDVKPLVRQLTVDLDQQAVRQACLGQRFRNRQTVRAMVRHAPSGTLRKGFAHAQFDKTPEHQVTHQLLLQPRVGSLRPYQPCSSKALNIFSGGHACSPYFLA